VSRGVFSCPKMPAKKKKSKQINLLPQEEFAATPVGRTLTWVLSTFRIIVITTEMFVMFAFLSRFWLDAKLADLNEEIRQKQGIITAFSDFERTFRASQEKLKIVSTAKLQNKNLGLILTEITSTLPVDIVLTSISFGQNGINISGNAPTEQSVSQFMANMKANEVLKKVSLGPISQNTDDNALLSFSLEVSL